MATDPIDELIDREGGYVDHAADRGGPTNYGVTLATLRRWREDPSLDASDVRELCRDEARAIYLDLYVERPRFLEVEPEALKWHLVDCGVMSGPQRATLWLQEALNRFRVSDKQITEDGLLGPQTLGALKAALAAGDGRAVNNELMAIRLRFVADLAQSDANEVKAGRKSAQKNRALFVSGWVNRCLKFLE